MAERLSMKASDTTGAEFDAFRSEYRARLSAIRQAKVVTPSPTDIPAPTRPLDGGLLADPDAAGQAIGAALLIITSLLACGGYVLFRVIRAAVITLFRLWGG